LTKIDFTGNLIDELIVINCPKLKNVDLTKNEFKKVDLSKVKIDTVSGKAIANDIEFFSANNNLPLEDINLENCKALQRINLNDCRDIKNLKGGMDFSDSLHSINFRDTNGLHFGGTTELKE